MVELGWAGLVLGHNEVGLRRSEKTCKFKGTEGGKNQRVGEDQYEERSSSLSSHGESELLTRHPPLVSPPFCSVPSFH